MYKRIILFLAATSLIIIGTSLAQEIEIFGGTEQGSGSTGDGQTMTGVDTGQEYSSGLDFSGDDSISLSSGEDTILGSGGSTGEVNSGPILPIISDPIPHLILSEVYFDGTDEWIEITNIGDGNFFGNFTLVGVKSTPLLLANISLLSGESKIFGDNLTQISGNRFVGKTGLALNLIDTAPINIQILVSGQIEDSFLVDQYRVNAYNDKKTSFEKISGISTRVQTGRVGNAQSGYFINPGIYSSTGNVTNVSFPFGQSGENSDIPISCISVDQRDLIKVSEIFAGDEKYPPYIELAINSDISLNSLSISGNRLMTGLEFSRGNTGTTLQKNSFLLISSTGLRNTEGIQSVRNRDFSMVSTGNYLLITIGSGQNGQVMDIVYLSGDSIGSSYYFGNTTRQCVRVLDSVDYFSPGFERKFLKYFSGTTLTKIEYIQIATGNQGETGTCLLSGSSDLFSGDIQDTTNISGVFQNYTIRILNVEYDPEGSDTNNEKITLLATNLSGDTTPVNLNSIFRLKVNGTNKTLPRTLPINTPTTFTKTFGFPNSTDDGQNVIIQLTYGDYIFDTYTYNPNKPSLEEEIITGKVQSTGIVLDLSGLQFSITYVLPNPTGKDVIEEIGIQVDAKNSLLTGIKLSDEWVVKIGNKKKKLSGFLHVGQENILSGNLGLVNKAACVSLFYKEDELTKFCYRTPKEGEKIYSSDTGLQTTSQENLDILNTLQLKRIDNKLCIRYKEQSFLCKRIPASKAEIKTTQEQKLYKGFASLMKQYIVNNRKGLYYDTPLKQYFDQLMRSKKFIAQGISKVDIYGQSVLVTDLKEQIKILQTTLPGIAALFEGTNGL